MHCPRPHICFWLQFCFVIFFFMKLPGPFSDTLHSPWSVVAWISYCRVSSGDATQNNNYNTYLSLLFTHKNTGGFMWLNKIFNISIAYFLFDTFAYRSRNTAFSFRYWQLMMCYPFPHNIYEHTECVIVQSHAAEKNDDQLPVTN